VIAFLLQQQSDRSQDVLIVIDERDIGHDSAPDSDCQYRGATGKAKPPPRTRKNLSDSEFAPPKS
jgi:hypothetical protein